MNLTKITWFIIFCGYIVISARKGWKANNKRVNKMLYLAGVGLLLLVGLIVFIL